MASSSEERVGVEAKPARTWARIGPSGIGKEMEARIRTRQLQVATGGQFKYMIVSKIVTFLKTAFLEAREMRPTLEQLLVKVKESVITEELKQWLANEGLPNHPRIRCVEKRQGKENLPLEDGPRFAYEPPLRDCNSTVGLLEHLRNLYDTKGGGLLRSLVDDSYCGADRAIKELEKEGKIVVVDRLDATQVLFYKPNLPELDKCVGDSLFVELWKKINISNKEMSHIKAHLVQKKMKVFNDNLIILRNPERKRKANAPTENGTVPKSSRKKSSSRTTALT